MRRVGDFKHVHIPTDRYDEYVTQMYAQTGRHMNQAKVRGTILCLFCYRAEGLAQKHEPGQT